MMKRAAVKPIEQSLHVQVFLWTYALIFLEEFLEEESLNHRMTKYVELFSSCK